MKKPAMKMPIMAMIRPIRPRPTTALSACPTLSLMRRPTTDATTKVIPVASAAMPIEATPATAIACTTRPVKVKPVSRLKVAINGSAVPLLPLLAAF